MAYKVANSPVNTNFLQAKDQVTSASPIIFYYISMPGVATPLAYTDYPGDSSVTYYKPGTSVSQNYTPAPISHDQVESNTKGEIGNVVITLQNVSRYIGGLLHQNDALRDSEVSIITAFRGHLDDSDACLCDTYYIDGASLSETAAQFQLAPKFAVHKVTLPFRSYIKDQCQWKFKDTNTCHYSGEQTSCSKTLASCDAYGNTLNYGGFPGIPSQRVIK